MSHLSPRFNDEQGQNNFHHRITSGTMAKIYLPQCLSFTQDMLQRNKRILMYIKPFSFSSLFALVNDACICDRGLNWYLQ